MCVDGMRHRGGDREWAQGRQFLEWKRSGTAERRRGPFILQTHIRRNRRPRSKRGDVGGIGWKGKDSLVVIL
jgi:hypothetical protein